jgi:hypothetical protein
VPRGVCAPRDKGAACPALVSVLRTARGVCALREVLLLELLISQVFSYMYVLVRKNIAVTRSFEVQKSERTWRVLSSIIIVLRRHYGVAGGNCYNGRLIRAQTKITNKLGVVELTGSKTARLRCAYRICITMKYISGQVTAGSLQHHNRNVDKFASLIWQLAIAPPNQQCNH